MTLGQKVDPILSRLVLRQMIPGSGVQEFNPARFVQSTDTLVIITDDQAETNVAALTTMMLAAVIDAAKAAAAGSPIGRLDPPLRVVGDEIVNVAPMPKLPGLLSNTRGSGVQWVLAFQSLAQILARWGSDEGHQIVSNLNCLIALGGLLDNRALDLFSDLVGSVDVTEVTTSMDAGNVSSGSQVTTTERTALRPEEIRGLDDGQALVIYRNTPAMIVDLIPYTARPDGDLIKAGIQRVRAARIGRP
jgi:type IV secretory pathway TraG/TraD family ATPase VirD4